MFFSVPASPAQADERPIPNVSPALQDCVKMALREKFQAWTCDARGVTISQEANGAQSHRFVSVRSSRPQVSIRGVRAQDDLDSWCENGNVCRRLKSDYIGETKGNAAYGDNNGVIGAYDAIITTNLNGRQARWTLTLIRDYGPKLNFADGGAPTQIVCWDWWGAVWITCGNHYFTNLPNALSTRWTSKMIYGNRLENADTYHGAFETYFKAAGYSRRWVASTLNTNDWRCPRGNGDCKMVG